MTKLNQDTIWVDVIEDVPASGWQTTTIRLDGPLMERNFLHQWLEHNGYRDIVDFRVVMGERVMPWGAPELEWVWIQNMTEPHLLTPPPRA
jgi:hypothetical protein